MRNLISLLATLFIALCGLSANAAAISVANDDGVIIYYDISGTNVFVTKGPSDGYYTGDLIIPSEINYSGTNYLVTAIGSGAFRDCTSLKTVTLPDGVTSIGYAAFFNCSNLTSVNIPDGVTSIGSYAFFKCSNLTSVNIPEGVTSIESNTFFGCSSLLSINIPDGVTTIGNSSFYQCSNLTSIYIPESVVSIGGSAFFYCSNLSSINIPDGVTVINSSTFRGCSNLSSINIPDGVTSIGSSAFDSCKQLASINIPESVTNIGSYALQSCTNLTSVDIPNGVTVIEKGTFSHCSNLQSVILPDGITSIEVSAFNYCSKLTSINIPDGVTSIGNNAFGYCSALSSIWVYNPDPSNIELGSDVFSGVPKSTCTLYVPKGSKELYAVADQWKKFSKIEEQSVSFDLIDGEVYNNAKNYNDIDITYTRNFKNTSWQALYVPFNMSYDEWSPYVDIAMIYNVRCYDYDKDNVLDEIVIEFNRLGEGDEIIPNVPYVVRAKQTGTYTFECTGKTLMAAPIGPNPIECASTIMTYSFYGVYESTTGLYEQGAYRLTGGEFCQYASANGTLSPYRFYMLATPKTGGYNQTSMPQRIKIRVIGDDEDTDSIDAIDLDTPTDAPYYDLLGRPVTNPTPGIYIHNGHKVLIK